MKIENVLTNYKVNFDIENIIEPKVKEFIKLIQKERKGLDQEFYIGNEN